MNDPFLDRVDDARKGRWRDADAEARGLSAGYYWTGRGRDALEVAYVAAGKRLNATALREVWRGRHGRAAALLVAVGYPGEAPRRAMVRGPAGMNPPVVDPDIDKMDRGLERRR